MECNFSIGSSQFSFEVDGDFFQGENQLLFQTEGNVIESCPWIKKGYHTLSLFDEQEFEALRANIKMILKVLFDKNGIQYDETFEPEDYHKIVQTEEQHQAVISETRFLKTSDFQIDLNELTRRISDDIDKPLSKDNPELDKEVIILRINRPGSSDFNPFHRDGYLGVWKNVLNVWIPLFGCNEHSSLLMIPGSHYWNEKDVVRTRSGGIIAGKQYHVPAVISSTYGLNAVRPNPDYGEALIFTPFILHGGAMNTNEDVTRISLELRLYHHG